MNISFGPERTDAETAFEAIKGMGLTMEQGRDFRVFHDVINSQPKRHKPARQFIDPLSQINVVDAAWICWRNEDGEVVHTQAMQLLDLTGSSVAEHIALNLSEYVPAMPKVNLKTARCIAGPQTSKISGKVAYHGEVWLDSSLKGRGAATLFQRHGFHWIQREWNPESIFGLMSWALACNGFATRIGYAHIEPLSAIWDREASKMEHQVWAVSLNKSDLQHLSLLPVMTITDHIANKFRDINP